MSINGQSGKAQLTTAPFSGNLETYIRQQFTKLGGEGNNLAPQSIERTTVNGIPAAYGTARVNNGQSQVDVVVFAYQFSGDRAYHFQSITPAGQASTFNAMYQSMRRVSDSEAANVVPRKIDVVTVARGDTVSSLARRMAYTDAQEARFRVLNGLGSNEGVAAGQKVKIVVRGR